MMVDTPERLAHMAAVLRFRFCDGPEPEGNSAVRAYEIADALERYAASLAGSIPTGGTMADAGSAKDPS